MVLSSARCRAATLSRGHAIAAVSAVALLAGCAVGPDFVAPQAPPTKDYEFGGMPQPGVENAADPQQRFSMGQKISGDWWQLFHSAQLDAAYLTLTGGAATQAVQIASARAQIQAVGAIIADDERNLALVSSQRQAGEATQLEVQLAESQLAADRTLLPPLRQQVSVARHALAILVGQAPGEWAPPDFDLAEFTLPHDLHVTLPSQLVRQRPAILASEAQLHAASAAVGVATAQLYPNLTLTD